MTTFASVHIQILATWYRRMGKGHKRKIEADICLDPHERTCIHIIIALVTFERRCEVKFEKDFRCRNDLPE